MAPCSRAAEPGRLADREGGTSPLVLRRRGVVPQSARGRGHALPEVAAEVLPEDPALRERELHGLAERWLDDVDGVQLLGVRRGGLSLSSWVMKRGMDLAGASLGLLALTPVLLGSALAIKVTSPGPVFFRQPRIGRDGRAFQILKLRSMVLDAEARKGTLHDANEAHGGLFKIADDPRITSVGRFLRRTSMDELPQLINVLKGEMSLVGPRPLVPDEDERIDGWHRTRLELVPGMTGFWQVNGSSRIPLPEMVKMDYLYGANWSLWLDIKILLRTVPYVLSRRGL